MENRKTNFIKDLFSKLDGYLAIFVGLCFGAGMLLAREIGFLDAVLPADMVSSASLAMIVITFVMMAVCLFVAVPNLTKRVTTKADFLLVVYFASSLISFILSLSYDKTMTTRVIVYLALLAVGLALLVARCFIVDKADENSGQVRKYFAALYQKFNVPAMVGAGFILGLVIALAAVYSDVLGIIGAMSPDFAKLGVGRQIMMVGGIGLIVVIILVILGLVKSLRKINVIDYIVTLGQYAMLGFVLYFGLKYFEAGRVSGSIIGVYLISFFALICLSAYRALICKTEEISEDVGRFEVYYGKTLSKYSVALACMLGIAMAAGLAYIDVIGFGNLTSTPLNSGLSIVTLIVWGLMFVAFVAAFIIKKFTSPKINYLDFILLTLLYAGLGLMFVVGYQYALYKLLVIIALAVIFVVLVVLRVKFVYQGVANEQIPFVETVEEDSIKVVEKTEEPVMAEEKAPEEGSTVVEETITVVEETVEETPSETKEEIVMPTENLEPRPTVKRTFINKLKFTSLKTKTFYSDIKNALLQYGVNSRITNKNEIFRKRGLVAKFSIAGKTLRIHLPLDVNDPRFEQERFHQFDLGDKRSFKDVPFTMKLKSNLSCKRCLELIDLICGEERKFRFKKKYEHVDFVPTLDVDGDAIFEKLGITHLMCEKASLDYAEQFNNSDLPSLNKICSLIPVANIEDGLNHEDGEEATVYVETALKYVEDKVISIDSLKAVNEISLATQRILVKMHDEVTEPITVICDDIDSACAVAILATHGKVMFYREKEYEVETDNRPIFVQNDEEDDDDDDDYDDELDLDNGEVVTSEGNETVQTVKRVPYSEKLHLMKDKAKVYYSEIKNELLSYGLTSRMVTRNETFRKNGLVAKISVSGKTLRLHLALDPTDPTLPYERYHQFSLAEKNAYREVPFTLKIKSDLAFRRAKELISILADSKGLTKDENYVSVDFASSLME